MLYVFREQLTETWGAVTVSYTHLFVLAPTARENIFKQKVYLYSLLAKPTEKVIFTLSKTDNAGKTLRKSYLISDLQKMFLDLKIKDVYKRQG